MTEFRVIGFKNQIEPQTGLEIMVVELSEVERVSINGTPSENYSWTPYNGDNYVVLRYSALSKYLTENPDDIKLLHTESFRKNENEYYYHHEYDNRYNTLSRISNKITFSLNIHGHYLNSGLEIKCTANRQPSKLEIDKCFEIAEENLKNSVHLTKIDLKGGCFDFFIELTNDDKIYFAEGNYIGCLTLATIAKGLMLEKQKLHFSLM